MSLIARRPSQELVDLVATLDGHWDGYRGMCRCPAHQDSTPSLSIRQGDRGILVNCFAGCASEDVLRELARVRVTGSHPMPEARPTGTANVAKIWEEAGPVRGTLGERYLWRRGLPPDLNDIRFHPRCPHHPKPHTVYKPALLVAAREGNNLVAVQRIFLDPETAWYTDKVTLGRLGAGVWQGGGYSSTIGLAEGMETAASYSQLKDVPCWASFGTRRFDLCRIPESVTKLILAGDPDGPGRLAVTKAIHRYVTSQRIVLVDYSPKGSSDWAAVLQRQKRGEGGEG